VDGPGREILLYLIMYWKYVRKWWLLIRNRIICPEVAVNEQILPGKSNLFFNYLKKSKFFKNLPGKNRIFLWNCLKKSKFLWNLPGKIEIFLTRIHDPQISNQIDAAAFIYFVFVTIIYNVTIQLGINNICSNNYSSAIRHNILRYGEWQKHNYLDIL